MSALTRPPKVIFFDAAGTLFHLPKGVGYHYALVGRRMGLALDANALNHAFALAWKEMPARASTGIPRIDDDKGWWRALVDRVFNHAAPKTRAKDRDTFFEAAYAHFAEASVWELYPEVIDMLNALRPRYQLAIISNFDARLRVILEHLGVSQYFSPVVISSEVGADKPDALIYERALKLADKSADEALHVGDDPVRDWEGASAAGIPIFALQRPRNSLLELLSACTIS